MKAKLSNTPREAWVDPDDAPELTDEFFANAIWKIGDQVITAEEGRAAASAEMGRGRPRVTVPKVSTTIRFDQDVLDAFKASGKGWQTRVNEAMRDWLKTHSPV
jgi:uncharacterized protein (DUF4415 family)